MGSGSFSISGSGSGSGSSLVLDGERGELVRAPAVRTGKKGGGKGGLLDEKAMIALRNHSEAERRRRERINSHLSVLRGMISGTEKVFSHSLVIYLWYGFRSSYPSTLLHKSGQIMCVKIRACTNINADKWLRAIILLRNWRYLV